MPKLQQCKMETMLYMLTTSKIWQYELLKHENTQNKQDIFALNRPEHLKLLKG